MIGSYLRGAEVLGYMDRDLLKAELSGGEQAGVATDDAQARE
jgi:hypothetical protein